MTRKPTWVTGVNRVAIVERFDTVLYPFQPDAFLRLLPSKGWIAETNEEEEGSVQVAGAITRGGVRLVINAGNKTLGVLGHVIDECLTAYRDIKSYLADDFELPPQVATDYVEFRYIGWKKSETSAMDVFRSINVPNDAYASLGSFLEGVIPADAPLGQYGVRICPIGIDANRQNWSELALYPEPVAGLSRIHFDLIYRNEDVRLVESAVTKGDEIIEGSLERLMATK